jgi:putative transcriptional regulator
MKRNALQKFRIDNNLTQEKMAGELNITVSHYKAVEYGIRNPSFELLERFKIKFPKASIDKIFLQ